MLAGEVDVLAPERHGQLFKGDAVGFEPVTIRLEARLIVRSSTRPQPATAPAPGAAPW